MENIRDLIIKNYTNNLNYLKDNDLKLYKRVVNLSSLIENNSYKVRYELEYIEDDKQFDIYDNQEKIYLYNKEASKLVKNIIDNTKLDKSNSIFLLNNKYYNHNTKVELYKEFTNYDSIDPYIYNDMFKYNKIFNAYRLDENKKFRYITKFIFSGIYLGTHIKDIVDNLNIKTLLLFEKELEIFRLSLFVTDYSQIANNRNIIFSIDNKKEDLISKIDIFYSKSFHGNYMLKYCSINNRSDELNSVISFYSSKSPYYFTYPLVFKAVLPQSIKNINIYPTLNTIKQYKILEKSKVIIIGAGPSLDKNIKWLKENKNNFFIICVSTALNILIENNIKPNLLIVGDIKSLAISEKSKYTLDKIQDIPFLTYTATHKNVLNKFNKENIYLFEVMSHIKDTSLHIQGGSVGGQALYLASILGAKNIYLLGLDMSLDPLTNSTHIKSHGNYEQIDKENHIIIKGNLRDTVATIPEFQKYLSAVNKIVLQYPNINIYNLSDGAYINNSIPTKVEDLTLEENSIKVDINKAISINSTIGFSNNEINYIKDSINFVDILIKKVKKIKKLKVKTYKDFLILRGEFLSYLSNEGQKYDRLMLGYMFNNYIMISEPYLEYNFNDKNLENEEIKIKKVKKVWCKQITKLCLEYYNQTPFFK